MKTNEIKDIICKHSQDVPIGWCDTDESLLAAANPKLWKRQLKVRVKNMGEAFGFEPTDPVPPTLGEFQEFGFEHVTYIKGKPEDSLPTDGWARYFINDELEDALDPTVITSGDDSEILAIFWHSD